MNEDEPADTDLRFCIVLIQILFFFICFDLNGTAFWKVIRVLVLLGTLNMTGPCPMSKLGVAERKWWPSYKCTTEVMATAQKAHPCGLEPLQARFLKRARKLPVRSQGSETPRRL